MSHLHALPKVTDRKLRHGRGISAGKGKTAGRGTKGQTARAGHNIPAGFEGGQTKLFMRLPKRRGESNSPRSITPTVTFTMLDRAFASGERVTPKTLKAKGLIPTNASTARIVASGTTTKTLKFSGVSFTSRAHQTIYQSSKRSAA